MVIFDIEANGLNPDTIYCLSYYNIETKEFDTILSYSEMIEFLEEQTILIGHNIIRYDVPVLERILGINIKARLIDTLALSWTLFPKLDKHGLADWGAKFGVPKPKIDDWENLSIEEYSHRCQEDVRINHRLWLKIDLYLDTLYNKNSTTRRNYVNYLMYKMNCVKEQLEIRWRLDVEKAQETFNLLTIEVNNRLNTLVSVMPRDIKYETKYPPKKLVKKDGELSSLGYKWYELLSSMDLPMDTESVEIVKHDKEGNPNSDKQLKAWLFELNWEPLEYKYVKDKNTGYIRKIPQVSPSGVICPSVKMLYDIEPNLQELEGYYKIKHRLGIVKGFLENHIDGYLRADMAGFTNTLRLKHRILVNMPGYTDGHRKSMEKDGTPDWGDGVHIRGLLIAEEGQVLVGSDLSSLEDRTKQHYMHFFDPDYVKSMCVKGFDPHLDLAEFAKALGSKESEFYKAFDPDKFTYTPEEWTEFNHIKKIRHDYKTVNYSAVYGVGAPTMSRNTKKEESYCEGLLKAYWDKNWSVKTIAKKVKIKKVGSQMWLYNPVSKFWYSLRYMKDVFSTLNQGTGVYVMDTWVRLIRSKGIKICGQFHDEVITSCTLEDYPRVKDIILNAIQEVNKTLNLNRDMDCDVHKGDNYAQIH